MSDQTRGYTLAAIRKLLLAAFTAEELRRFLQDRPTFRPVVARFGPGHGLDDMVDRVIDFCETHLLWPEFLAEVQRDNPRQYARFEPELPPARRPMQTPSAPKEPDAREAPVVGPALPSARAYLDRGIARYNQGDLPAAIADFDQAVALAPQYATAYYNRGLARKDVGDLPASIADFDRAIALNPRFAGAHNNRGIARYDLGDLPAAIADYDRAIALFFDGPDKARAYNNRGLARYDLGDPPAAIADYDRAIALDAQYADPYYNRGRAHKDRGETEQAVDDLRKYLELGTDPHWRDQAQKHLKELTGT
jgi:tetratricopeptide (TPR) repeat protein